MLFLLNLNKNRYQKLLKLLSIITVVLFGAVLILLFLYIQPKSMDIFPAFNEKKFCASKACIKAG